MPRSPWPLSRLVGLLLSVMLLLSVLLRSTPAPGPDDPVQRLGSQQRSTPVLLSGTLLEDPRPLGVPPGQPCRLLLQTATGRSELLLQHCPRLQQGWRVRVWGQLRRPRAAPHPLLAGPAERLARQQVWSQVQVQSLQLLERPATPIADLRRAIAQRFIAYAGAERGGLLAALVIGSAVVPLPQSLSEAFRAAGLSHALAASGFHLTVLLGASLAMLRPFGRGLRLLGGGAAIALFLLLAGPQPSVVRAVLMGTLALLLLEAGLKGRALGLLGLSAGLMLLLKPSWWHDVGFQLSVAATAGLLVSAAPLERWLAARLGLAPAAADPGDGPDSGRGDAPESSAQPGPGLRGRPGGRGPSQALRRWLAASAAVPLAATIWTLPLQLLHFGVIPLYAVPANLLATPLLTPLTLGAMLLAFPALLLPPLLPLLGLPLERMAAALQAIAQLFASLPLAQCRSGRPLPALVLLLSVALLGLVLPGIRRRGRSLALALFALAVALQIALLQSDQLLLVHQASPAAGRDLLVARHRGRAALIASHADGPSCRHSGQLASGLGVERYDWLLLLDPVAPADPLCWQRLSAHPLAYGSAEAPLRAGEQLRSPGLVVQALSADSHALQLQAGSQHWLLLPDRQAFAAWSEGQQTHGRQAWLGFLPSRREQRLLQAARPSPRTVWISGAALPSRRWPHGWLASGASGYLASGG